MAAAESHNNLPSRRLRFASLSLLSSPNCILLAVSQQLGQEKEHHFTIVVPLNLTLPEREDPPEGAPVGLIVSEILCGELEMEFASVAVTLTVKVPEIDGVPSMVQPEWRAMPAGTPEFAAQVTGAVPPEVAMVWTA